MQGHSTRLLTLHETLTVMALTLYRRLVGTLFLEPVCLAWGMGLPKGSPKARVAAYKVCWPPINGSECFDADIMAAFDTAIHDGVDVLSVSLGGNPSNYFDDGLSIGAFHAVKHGIGCHPLYFP